MGGIRRLFRCLMPWSLCIAGVEISGVGRTLV